MHLIAGPAWNMGSLQHIVSLLLSLALFIAAIFVLPVWAVLGWLRDRRAPNLLLERSTRCLDCQYDLSGLEERGACPECGGAYDLTPRRPIQRES